MKQKAPSVVTSASARAEEEPGAEEAKAKIVILGGIIDVRALTRVGTTAAR
jgi:hypothetical protein